MPNPLVKFIDPNAIDQLPMFATYDSASAYGGTIYDSNISAVGHFFTYTSSELGSYAYYGNGTTQVSSQSTTNLTAYTIANQAEGNITVNPPAAGGYGAMYRHASATASIWNNCGTVIGFAGNRQKISIYAANNTIAIYPRSALSPIESIASTNTSTFRNIIGEPGTNSYGMISYNQRINAIAYVVCQSSGSNYRVHVWKHPRVNLNDMSVKTGDLYRFLTEAKSGTNGASYYYNDFTWSTTSSTSYSESMYHNRIILGDNEVLGLVRFTPSNNTIHSYATLNPSGTSITGSVTQLSTNSNTTSYGIEQGNLYGMRSNNTWDNNWIACYAPYYYYGAGFSGHFVYTPDPSKGYKYQNADSSAGCQILPFRENGWIFHRSLNADGGNGFYYALINPEGSRVNGITDNGSAVANGGALTVSAESGYLDVTYTSTLYPAMLAVNSWVGGGK